MYEYNLAIRFERIAEEYSLETALWLDQPTSINYGKLNRLANRLARLLSEKGIRAGDVVCISGQKTIATFAFVIACLKLGAVYSVFDPDSPTERLRKILSTCVPSLVIGEREFLAQVESMGFAVLGKDPELIEAMTRGFAGDNLAESKEFTGSNPAYIMFTSGSTGFPKGAVMTHANVLNLIEWARETFEITAGDILTNVNPLYFDNSVFDFYAALFNGARLVPFNKTETRDPKLLVEKLDAAGCTLWFSVPSLLIFLQTMRATDGQRLRSIRRFIFGGEGYPKAKLKALYDAYPEARLFNVYGPTECTCICSAQELMPEDFADLQGLPRLGRIARNFDFLILNDVGKPAAVGEIGELCLLGPNVGLGYYNDPERTALSFVQNPAHQHFPEIIYKTGDLARLNQQGDLHIQGRKDNQVKHMGYRIELEEIEAALNCLHYVSEAAVLHGSVSGLSKIIAVVAAGAELDSEQIRADLRQIIPDYMIPTVFHREEVLPKNPSGKVDRRFLAEKYIHSETAKGSVNG